MLLAKARMATGMLSELVASPKPSLPSSEEPHIHLAAWGVWEDPSAKRMAFLTGISKNSVFGKWYIVGRYDLPHFLGESRFHPPNVISVWLKT